MSFECWSNQHARSDRAWVLLKSGRKLDLLDPSPLAWTNADLASGLARTYRWGGHSAWALPLSVAQHSITVLRLWEQAAPEQPTAAKRLRELLHDADEGLLGFDAITPLKLHLGDSYAQVVRRLRRAIEVRYGLPAWNKADHAAHKASDRLAAASEAAHVVGWSTKDLRDSLGITVEPLKDDPVLPPPGMRAWEPWSPNMAARLFLDLLESMQRDRAGGSNDAAATINQTAKVEKGHLRAGRVDEASDRPAYVVAEGGSEIVEGRIVAGSRDDDGS